MGGRSCGAERKGCAFCVWTMKRADGWERCVFGGRRIVGGVQRGVRPKERRDREMDRKERWWVSFGIVEVEDGVGRLFVTEQSDLSRSDAVAKKSRVRDTSSESVVGLKNADRFANVGSRGDSPLRGVGQSPTKSNEPPKPFRGWIERSDGGRLLACVVGCDLLKECGSWDVRFAAKGVVLEKLFDRRVIMVTGKGGVGKTTITAALARVAAKQGKRVLALDLERDLESPSTLLRLLGGPDAFRKDEPYVISPQISCARLTPRGGHFQFLIDQVPFKMMAQAAMNSKYLTRFLMAAPGFQELGLIYRMLPYIRKDPKTGRAHYDVVLVDLPATGHALALTSLPKPFLQIFQGGPIRAAIEEAQHYFYDTKVTGAVAVTLPEPLPVSETFELLEGLRRDRVPIAGVIVNRIPQDPFEDSERQSLLEFFLAHRNEVLGEWSLRRILRSREALERLQQGFAEQGRVPLLTLEEQWVEQPGACMAALMQIFLDEPWLMQAA